MFPKGCILGPLLFVIFINNLSDCLNSNLKLFVDNTSLSFVVQDKNSAVANNRTFQWKNEISSKYYKTS